MRPYIILPVLGILSGIESFAASGSATVVVLRGQAKTADGKTLSEKDKVNPGATVITGPRSFVRLLFTDNTQLNVGPDTTMKIEAGKPGEASIVDLVGGQIRAKVTKDPLLNQGNGPVKEKMVIKTKTAAMGIRGTDFNVSFNPENNITALITFEGNVAMTKLDQGTNPFSALHATQGVQSVGAGQFSGVQPDLAQATVPVKISPSQLETLKGNDSFQGLGEKSKKQDAGASPIPPGVDPRGFASGSERALKEAVAKTVGESTLNSVVAQAAREASSPSRNAPPPEGFLNKKTGEYAPRAGGFIDLTSGRYVPPPAGSAFDANTGVFVPPKALGTVDPTTGMYVPPKGVELDPVKGFVAEKAPAPTAATSPDGQRVPSGTAPPPPPPTVVALVTALNEQTKPENSTKTVTLDNSFSAGGAAVSGTQTYAAPPPPPPTTPPPPPPPNTDPVSDKPISYNCATDNSCGGTTTGTTTPTSTGVTFSITVQ